MILILIHRALTLGLSVDDVVAVDSFIDDLKCNKTVSGGTGAQIKSATEVKELKLRVSLCCLSCFSMYVVWSYVGRSYVVRSYVYYGRM